MLYVYCGSDTGKSRAKLNTVIQKLLEKQPGAPIVKIDAENFSESLLGEILVSNSLFAEKKIVVLDGLLGNKKTGKVAEKVVPYMAKSDSVFFVIESEIGKPVTDLFSKHAEKVVVSDLKVTTKESFNIYALADAIGARDRKNAWRVFHEGREAGIAGEELFWKVAWQVKNLILVSDSKATPENTGMKAYPFSKAKSALRNWNVDELKNLYGELFVLCHESRRSNRDQDTGLELLLLNL